jgi:hypothetical protein
MSASLRTREDKQCLNCGHQVPDIYCSHCGQPNIDPRLTLADLLRDFIHMITHFDGKFFQTLRVLFTRPGFLSRTYLDGKRRQYLPPVQMYVFTSALFFFIFYSYMVNIPDAVKGVADGSGMNGKDSTALQFNISEADSSLSSSLKTPEDYIKYQDALPKDKRDGYIARIFKISEIKINKRINEDGTEVFQQLIQSFLKNFPKLLLISLPLLAVILNLIFYRKKSFSYVSHLIFLLHLYVFTFVALLISYIFTQLNSWTSWSIFNWLAIITQLWILYYGYQSMRNLYQTSKWKGRLQYLTFLFSGMIIVFLLFIGDILYTILSA